MWSVSCFSYLWVFVTPWIVDHQAPLSMGMIPTPAFLLLFFSCSVMSKSVRLHKLQHARLPCASPTPGACSNSCPSSHWCHPTVSFSVIPFSFCPQSFPASGSFPMSPFFTPGAQSIGVSSSVLPMNIQYWYPLWLTDLFWDSLGLSRVFSLQFKSINSLALGLL